MTVEEPIWSIWNCSKCKPLKTRPYEESHADRHNNNREGQMMNSVSCPYKYIEFRDDGIIKSRIPYGDTNDRMFDWKDRCNDCGVPTGKIHHITCDAETCPRCGGQLIRCMCCLAAMPDLTPKEIHENMKNPTVYDYVITLDSEKRVMIFKDVFLHKNHQKIPKC